MNIPSSNPGLSPVTSGVPDQSSYSPEEKKSPLSVSSHQDDLAGVYQQLGFGSSESQSSPMLQPQAPSLEEPAVVMNPALIMDLLSSLVNKQSTQDMKSSIGLLQTNMNNEHVSVLKQIAEDQKVMQDAAKAHKASFWDKVFGWIGAVVMDVVAIVATAATGGAMAPLMVTAFTATALMGLEQGGVIKDMTDAMVKSLEHDGLSSKDAQIFAEVFTVAIILTATIVSSVVSGGLSGASQIAEDTSELGETEMSNFAEVGEQDPEELQAQEENASAQRMKMNMGRLAAMGRLTNVILKFSESGLSTISSVDNSDQLKAKATVLDWQAWATRNEKAVSVLQNTLKEMVKMIQQNTNTAAQAISSYASTQEKVAQYSQV